MPGAEHVLEYHMMARGVGWAATDGQAAVRLSTGDIIMFPRGDGHVLSSTPGLRASPDNASWVYDTCNDPKPIALSYHRGVVRPGADVPAEEAQNVIVCGFIGCDLRPFNPLVGALPRMLHLPADGVGDWVRGVLDQAVSESRERRPGSDAVLKRASEMVFVDAARRYLEHLPADASGWLAGLRDPFVGKAIALLQESPAQPWAIDDLGRRVGLSRSALHERFVRFVGQPPMQYLAQWRIQRGANLLRSGHDTVARIALEVGYESEAAFARAFKRVMGAPPGAWRRAQAAPVAV
jgi:AraC-like DNA-binding protein